MTSSSQAGPATALVTGASSGIGAATVRALRDRGFEVHAVARREERLAQLAEETGCVVHVLDVRDREAVAALGRELPVDILVNNAGLGRAIGAIWRGTDDDIDRTVDTNLTAAIHVIRAVLPGMIERGRGHIVNVSSVMALRSGHAALYGATKGGMHMLSRDLRHELEGSGIRVSEICPGRVVTEFYDVAIDDEERRERVKDTPSEDLTPADVADAIVYVVSAPRHVDITLMEIFPTEQTYGGSRFVALEREENELEENEL